MALAFGDLGDRECELFRGIETNMFDRNVILNRRELDLQSQRVPEGSVRVREGQVEVAIRVVRRRGNGDDRAVTGEDVHLKDRLVRESLPK